jgi:excisionase family DNA binding protein
MTEKIEFLTVEEVSDQLKIHWQTTLNYIRSGQLKAAKIGKGYKINKNDLMDFIEKKSNIK